MRLITRLTTLASVTTLALVLSSCAGNSPKRPTSTADSKSATDFTDRCAQQHSRGQPTDIDCPYPYNGAAGQRDRAVPTLRQNRDPLPTGPLPELPNGGGVLGR